MSKKTKTTVESLGDVQAVLDLKIEAERETATKAIKFTDRRQAAVKAGVLTELRDELFGK